MKKCKIAPDLKCVRENYYHFAGSVFNIFNDSSETSRKLQKKCTCLPDCILNAYPSEVSTGALSREFSFNSKSFFKDVDITDQTLIHIFFNDLISTRYRKDMYQNWLGTLAAFGGNTHTYRVTYSLKKSITFFFYFKRFIGTLSRILPRNRF